MSSVDYTPTEHSESLQEFIAWLKTIERDELEKWIVDAFWKDHLKESEILRFFLLSQAGVDMRTVKKGNKNGRSVNRLVSTVGRK